MTLASALDAKANLDLADWARGFEARRAKPPKPPKVTKELDVALVTSYVRTLRSASDPEQLADLVTQMKKDKAVDKRHLFEIAAQFTGDGGSFKKASDALESIQSAFVEQQRFSNKLRAAHFD